MFQVPVPTLAAAVVVAASTTAFSVSPVPVSPESSGSMPPVVANDNRRPAGRLEGGTLKLSLRAGSGSWQQEGPDGPRLSIEAFGEGVSPLTVPAPLIRAEAGTLIDVTLRNDLGVLLQVHGLCARNGAACPPVSVPPHDVSHVQFRIDQPGTYHYWATTMGAPVPFRELSGGLVIDPRGAIVDDRVLVVTEWTSLTPPQLAEVIRADDPGKVFVGLKPRLTFVINGLSWPATERRTYRVGETARLMPPSWCDSRPKVSPDPATRSVTVRDTSTSAARAVDGDAADLFAGCDVALARVQAEGPGAAETRTGSCQARAHRRLPEPARRRPPGIPRC